MPPEALAEEQDSSPSSDSQDVTEQSSSSDVEQTMEDAILSVVGTPSDEENDQQEEGDADPEGVSDPSPDGEQQEQAGDPQEAEQTDEDFIQMLRDNNVPLGKIERFQEIIHDRQALRTENEGLVTVRDNLAGIQEHGARAGLTQQQLENWFSMPVLLANDPAKAQTLISEFMADISQRTGLTLSPELQEKVEQGYMDEDSAKELSKANADLDQANRDREQEAEKQQAIDSANSQSAIVNAVNTYQQGIQQSDPDYSPEKHEFVKRELTALVAAKGMPETPEEAVVLAKEAHKSVSERLAAFKPKPKSARTISGRGHQSTPAAQPKTMFEAINASLQAAE